MCGLFLSTRNTEGRSYNCWARLEKVFKTHSSLLFQQGLQGPWAPAETPFWVLQLDKKNKKDRAESRGFTSLSELFYKCYRKLKLLFPVHTTRGWFNEMLWRGQAFRTEHDYDSFCLYAQAAARVTAAATFRLNRNFPLHTHKSAVLHIRWTSHCVSRHRLRNCWYFHTILPAVWGGQYLYIKISQHERDFIEKIIESLRLDKTSKIIKSNCQPNTTMPAKPCPKVPHLHIF